MGVGSTKAVMGSVDGIVTIASIVLVSVGTTVACTIVVAVAAADTEVGTLVSGDVVDDVFGPQAATSIITSVIMLNFFIPVICP